MSTAPLRPAMVPVTRQMRAYFAPVNRTTESADDFRSCGKSALFAARFAAEHRGLTWDGSMAFERLLRHADRSGAVGTKALPVVQFRGPLEARVEFEFREWGKLQMALAGGSEHMNVLATGPSANAQRLRAGRRWRRRC